MIFLQDESLSTVDRSDIPELAKIFSKEPLTSYQQKVNEAAVEICLHKPSYLSKRGELLELARKRVHQSGYDYKKRKSRSKMFGSSSEPEAKRPKTTKTERLDQLKGVRQQLSDVKDRVKYKRQRLAAAETSKNYKLCDQLSEEIADLNKEMILQEKEV